MVKDEENKSVHQEEIKELLLPVDEKSENNLNHLDPSSSIKVKSEDCEENAQEQPSAAESELLQHQGAASPPPLKKLKVEPAEPDDWDDGGIADEDLAGVV